MIGVCYPKSDRKMDVTLFPAKNLDLEEVYVPVAIG